MAMRRPAAALIAMTLAAGGLLSAGCAAAPLATPEEVAFAPSLNVDLAAMERLPSGVRVRDLREGAGAPAQSGRRVAVHFVGWLPDGTQFDGLAPPNPPAEFTLGAGEVIRGWDLGLVGMREGGQRMLVVPAVHGYGARRSADVPSNSVLVFVVELQRVR